MSAWGESWAEAWGDSWGAISSEVYPSIQIELTLPKAIGVHRLLQLSGCAESTKIRYALTTPKAAATSGTGKVVEYSSINKAAEPARSVAITAAALSRPISSNSESEQAKSNGTNQRIRSVHRQRSISRS